MHAAVRADDDPAQRPILRSRVAIELHPALRGRLAALAAGRAIAIDWFASRCCTSVWVGDLTARWLDPGRGVGSDLVELAPIEGVPVHAATGLLGILGRAGPTLRLSGPTFARHLSVALDDPSAWIDFLETPGAHRRH